ncbi:RICIN domain-containing protein [Actinoplanes sp. NBC_00393]|uniref:RICIN domain-containing protein n=1 Tax=Actinoplanes sp. NBC_00393 TaxID=2975953 RepID=UPI002E246759
MIANSRALGRRLLTVGLAAATFATVVPAVAHAAPALSGTVLAAAAAEPNDKLAVAIKFGYGDDYALQELADRDFIIELWKRLKDNSDHLEVTAAAEQAFGTVADEENPAATELACHEFIVTGVFEAFDRDVAREQREAEAKRQSDAARAAAAASINVIAGAELLNATDTSFIQQIWDLVENNADWPKVKSAAAAALAGTAEEQQAFISAGMAAAAQQDTADRIAKDDAKTEAEKAAALARAAKQFAANRIGMPVTEQLLALPDRDFITEVWNFTEAGTEVQDAAIAAVRSLDPAVWKAFIDTGIHQARDRDIQEALDAAEAADRKLANDVVARADAAGNRNLALAGRRALAGNAQVVNDFVRVGQYAVRPDLPDRIQSGLTGMCMGVPSGAKERNTQIIQWPCSGAKDQGWQFFPKTAGYYQIRNVNSGLCLAMGSASTAANAYVIQWTCTNGREQQWAATADSTGFTRLKNLNSGMCMGLLNNAATQGTRVVQQACSTATAQGWHTRARGLVNFEAATLNNDAYTDVIATEVSSGRLYLYPGTAAGDAFGARVLIGNSGWNGMDKLATSRLNSDNYDDLIAVEKSTGKLWLYPGTASAGLGTRVEIGLSGWNNMEKLTASRFNADAYEDLLAVDVRDGKLYLYPGTAAGTLGSRVAVGTATGWNGYDKFVTGKFTRDDHNDLIAVEKATGKLWLYPGGSNGTLGTRIEIGTGGWNGVKELTAGHFNRDSYEDLLVTDNATGKVFYYPGTADGKIGSRVEIGIGS